MSPGPPPDSAIDHCAMSPQLHQQAYSEAYTALESDGHVLITGAPGLGRTRLGLDVSRAFSRAHDRALIRVPVRPNQSHSSLRALLPAAIRDQRMSAEDVASALADELGADCVLFIDDAHRLSEEDAGALEALLRRPRHRPNTVITIVDLPGRAALLRRMRRDRVATMIVLPTLDRASAGAFIQSLAHPGSFAPETEQLIWDQCGGIPLLLTEYASILQRRHSVTSPRGAIIWNRTTVRLDDAGELHEALTIDLSPDGVRAAVAVATLSSLSLDLVSRLTSPAALAELQASGLTSTTGRGVHERIRMEGRFVATCLAAGITAHEHQSLIDDVLRLLRAHDRPVADWTEAEMHGVVREARIAGRFLPLPLTYRAWSSARIINDRDLHIALATALHDHPDASPDQRLEALIDRIAQSPLDADPRVVEADISAGEEIAPHASVKVRTEFLVARARVLLLHSDDPYIGLLALDDEIAALSGDDPDVVAARESLIVHRLSLLVYGGEFVDSHAGLVDIFHGPKNQDTGALASGPFGLIAAQRGDISEARAILGKHFPRALSMATTHPWLPSEIIGSGFIVDLLAGRVTAAARTVKRLDGVLVKIASSKLPPGDSSMLSGGRGLLAAAEGSWEVAIEHFEAALAGLNDADAFGNGAHLLSSYAVALAALGESDRAWDAILECREGTRGISRAVGPWASCQLLYAELWMGRNVGDAAMELAASARDSELGLIELRALHLVALAHGSQTAPEVLHRAQHLVTTMTAPIASPLGLHIAELSAGLARLDGQGARMLARHGLFVPPRGGPGELTVRERQVATSAALGFSAKVIASQFGNSKRTIDAHLNRIYVKLGVSGREDLAEALDAARD